jgi:hypothetical protein
MNPKSFGGLGFISNFSNAMQQIFGNGYYCKDEDCEDYNLCFKCYKHVADVHYQGHEFEEKH